MCALNRIFLAIIASLLFQTFAFAQIGSEEEKEPRTPVELEADLKINLVVKYEGKKTSRSGGFKCPQHRGRSAYSRNINAIYFNQATFNGKMLSGETKSLPGLVVQSLTPSPYGTIYGGNVGQPYRRPPNPLDGYRSTSFHLASVDLEGGGVEATLTVNDHIQGLRPDEGNSKCWRRERGTAYKPEKATVDGKFAITYEPPKGSQFVKIEIPESTELLSGEFVSRAEGALHPQIYTTRENYLWLNLGPATQEIRGPDGKVKVVNRDQRVKIWFQYNSHVTPVSMEGLSSQSKLTMRFIPIRPTDTSLSYADRLIYATELFMNVRLPDENLIREVAPLIEQSNLLDGAVRALSLEEIREIQKVFFEFALRATFEGQVRNPFVKAMAAVVMTKISENLSSKLLPVCVVDRKTMPILGHEVVMQRYVYMMFYLIRILDRLEHYEPLAAFNFVGHFQELELKGLTTLEIANNKSLMEKLDNAYRVFATIHSEIRQPMQTAYGEYVQLHQDATEFIEMASNHEKIMDLLREGYEREGEIYAGIHQIKRSIIRNPSNDRLEAGVIRAHLQRLDFVRQELMKEIALLTEEHLFASPNDLSADGFADSLLTVFEGFALVKEVASVERDPEVITYYNPIFDHYFDTAKIERTAEQMRLCISGQLLEEN